MDQSNQVMSVTHTSIVAVVFCDVVESTQLRVRLGDDAADVLNARLTDQIRRATESNGGVVIKALGDGVMAIFRSAVGALSGAIAMHCAAVSVSADIALRVGIAVGEAAEDKGDWFGTPVVEAARLCSAAGSGEILIADLVRVLIGSRGNFTFESAGPLHLKGLPDPIEACRVPWERPLHTATAASAWEYPVHLALLRTGPFVGRDLLADECFDALKNRSLRTLIISGEPGIGKTRLAAEVSWKRSVEGALVVVGRCDPDLTTPYRPWSEALGSLVA